MKRPDTRADNRHVVLYDGVCGLCDRTVRLLLEIDRDGVLQFAPLQGVSARQVVERLKLSGELKTMAFVEAYGSPDERVSTRSTGILRLLRKLGGVWCLVAWLRIVPRPIRDAVYDRVATNRYRWFGKFDACKLPPPELRERFLP